MNNSHTLKGRLSLFIWIVIIAALVSAPSILPVFRLNLLGRYLSLAIARYFLCLRGLLRCNVFTTK